MGTDEAIIYSYDIATVSSIIPAFANRKDVLIIDEVCLAGWPQEGMPHGRHTHRRKPLRKSGEKN
eukprot:1159014-Pelagomonas_calceolata.AAC.9